MDNYWENKTLQNPKLRSYILFNKDYFEESYVNYCIPHQKRSLSAQIRFGMLPLQGDLKVLNLEDKLCQIYNNQVVQDELHFVCKCNMYVHCKQI